MISTIAVPTVTALAADVRNGSFPAYRLPVVFCGKLALEDTVLGRAVPGHQAHRSRKLPEHSVVTNIAVMGATAKGVDLASWPAGIRSVGRRSGGAALFSSLASSCLALRHVLRPAGVTLCKPEGDRCSPRCPAVCFALRAVHFWCEAREGYEHGSAASSAPWLGWGLRLAQLGKRSSSARIGATSFRPYVQEWASAPARRGLGESGGFRSAPPADCLFRVQHIGARVFPRAPPLRRGSPVLRLALPRPPPEAVATLLSLGTDRHG